MGLWNEIDLSEVPWALDKASNGFFDFSNPDLSHLTIEGKDIFKKWREAVGKRVAMEGQEEEIEGSTFVDDDHTDEEEEFDFDHIDVDNDEESEEMDERKYIGIMSEKFPNLKRNYCTEAGEENVTKEDNSDLENDGKDEEIKGKKEIEIEQVNETFYEEPKSVLKEAKESTMNSIRKPNKICYQICENRKKYTRFLRYWKGSYGFIEPDVYCGISSIFIHISEISRPRPWVAPGMRLEFSVDMDTSRNKQRAVSARVLMFRN